MVDREAGVAVWRQIERRMAEEIAAGQFGPGTRLPTEQELAQRFSVNRHTLRRAMSALANRGLVRVEQGRGTFVSEHVLDYFISERTRFSEIVVAQHRQPGGTLLSAEVVRAGKDVAQALAIRAGSRCHLLVRLGEVDGRAVSLAHHYFPCSRFEGFAEIFKETGSISHSLAHYGLEDYQRRRSKVTSRLPSAEEAQNLRLAKTTPLLVVEAINVDRDGRPIEFGRTCFASDRVQLIFET